MDLKQIGFKGLMALGLVALLWGGALPAVAQEDVAQLSDEFDDADTLTNWLQFHEVEGWPNWYRQLDINTTSPGNLYLDLATSSWYEDYHGTFMFKEVTGDFIAMTRLQVRGHESDVPTALWSLCGIMVRTPRDITAETWTPGGENWIFLTTGVADTPNTPVFETKTTETSQSILELYPAQAGWIELALARVGEDFGLFGRPEDAEWVLLRQYTRPDMPETLQVGLTAYTDFPTVATISADVFNQQLETGGHPDLVALVDYFRFLRPANYNGRELTESTWLSFLPPDVQAD